jgi:hypothetical protein
MSAPHIAPNFNGLVITRYYNGVECSRSFLKEGPKCDVFVKLVTDFIESGNLFDDAWIDFSVEKNTDKAA